MKKPRKLQGYRGPLSNPSSSEVARTIEKAREWFGDAALVTEPETMPWNPPKTAVHIGQLVAIEYLSDKFDGVETVYRHVFDEMLDCVISLDGRTIVLSPGLKITDRGIEG
jgi:hypothetical protein